MILSNVIYHRKENYILDLDQYKHTRILENWIIKPIYVTNRILFLYIPRRRFYAYFPFYINPQNYLDRIWGISLRCWINQKKYKSHYGIDLLQLLSEIKITNMKRNKKKYFRNIQTVFFHEYNKTQTVTWQTKKKCWLFFFLYTYVYTP